MNGKRLVVALFGLCTAVVVGYLAFRFAAALTVAIFICYSARRFRLPARLRTGVVLASVVVPLLVLVSYTLVLLVVEARRLVERSSVVALTDETHWLGDIGEIPSFTAQGLYRAYRAGDLDPFVRFFTENAEFLTSVVSGFFLNAFVVVIIYYLLVDGGRIRSWLPRFDDDAIIRE
jgi:predicted PurR-regulated permease PerM